MLTINKTRTKVSSRTRTKSDRNQNGKVITKEKIVPFL